MNSISDGGVESGELYLTTFKELKKEIAESVKEERALERNMLLACGAVLAYATEHGGESNTRYLLWLPFILAGFGAYRALMLMISVRPRAQYLDKIEKMALAHQALKGWETYFQGHYRRGVRISIFVFWAALCGATFAIAIGCIHLFTAPSR